MACNTTVRNNLVNGHRKRGSSAIAKGEDDSRTGCCCEATIEQRFKETRMDALRCTLSPLEADMPTQRNEDDDRRFSVCKSSGGGGVEVRTGQRGIGEEGTESERDGRRTGEQEEWQGEQTIGQVSTEGQGMRGLGEMRRQRKLVLHFDIRNTILVADSVTQVKVEQALNTFLTGVTWGRETDNEWMWLSDTPSLRPPCDGASTYYKHLERQLAQVPHDRALLRQATGDFTQVPLGEKFRPCFEKHLRLLRWNQEVPDKLLTMTGCDNRHYHYLLPSFVRLLYKLQADGRNFAVVLRTYGMDACNVLCCLQYIVGGNHPDFGGRLPIEVRRNPGWVRCHEDGGVEFGVPKDGNDTSETEADIYSDELQIYKLLSESRGISGFVDDFGYWQRNSYSHRAGKPFWIDLADDAVQHIFFDDNIRVTAEDSIVDVRLARPDGRSFESIDLNRMSEFENACLVQADLLESINNVEYFVEKVRTCERNYTRLTGRRVPPESLESNAA